MDFHWKQSKRAPVEDLTGWKNWYGRKACDIGFHWVGSFSLIRARLVVVDFTSRQALTQWVMGNIPNWFALYHFVVSQY